MFAINNRISSGRDLKQLTKIIIMLLVVYQYDRYFQLCGSALLLIMLNQYHIMMSM